MEALIHLDTHVAVWLYAGDAERLAPVRGRLATSRIAVSPMVVLELQYLYEIGRVTEAGQPVISDLIHRYGLELSEVPFSRVAHAALAMNWTRDPFDRLIAAQAAVENVSLLTRDASILQSFPLAVWP